MSRRYSNRRYRVVRPKRNSERILRGGTSVINPATQQVAYTFLAMDACVVKSIKLDVGKTTGVSVANAEPLPYVLVHVREGYNANSIGWPAINTDMYNPTGDVLISGVLTNDAVEDHKWNMIGRKIKPSDRLCLIFYNPDTVNSQVVSFEMNFSVLT